MPLKIKSGDLILYYCFDIGNEIALDKVEKVFGQRPEHSELVVERLTPKYIKHRVPPLLVRMGKASIEKRQFDVTAKIYDFGVVAVRLTGSLGGSLSSLKNLSERVASSKSYEAEARKLLEKIKKDIGPAVVGHHVEMEEFFEDYIIFKVNQFDKKIDLDELLKMHSTEIAKALRCDAGDLSEREIQDAVKTPLSYHKNDLVIVDWNAAFMYDRAHSYDVIDVLEYALIESLELRVYDTALDIVIDKAYDDLLGKKRRFGFYPFASKLKYLSTIKLEISDIVEKVSNFIKLVGDVYLAKVYSAASERFYMNKWRESLNAKMEIVEGTYEDVSKRITDRRMVIMELLIVLLFIVDLILIAMLGI